MDNVINQLIQSIFGGIGGSNFDAQAQKIGLDPSNANVIAGLTQKLSSLENQSPEEFSTMGQASQNMNQQKMLKSMLNHYSKKYPGSPAGKNTLSK